VVTDSVDASRAWSGIDLDITDRVEADERERNLHSNCAMPRARPNGRDRHECAAQWSANGMNSVNISASVVRGQGQETENIGARQSRRAAQHTKGTRRLRPTTARKHLPAYLASWPNNST